jgi:excisionase family DNA binding protein
MEQIHERQKKLLTRPEAAEHLSVCLRTIDELTAKRALRAVKIGRAVRYRMQSLEEFIEANEKP